MDQSSDRGWQCLERKEFAEAQQHYEKAVQLANELNDNWRRISFSQLLGLALNEQDKLPEAKDALERALRLAESEDDLRVVGHGMLLACRTCSREMDESAAIALLWRALDSALEVNDGQTSEVSLGCLGEIYRNRGWLEQAAECFRQAAELGEDKHNRIAWLGNLGQTLAEMGD